MQSWIYSIITPVLVHDTSEIILCWFGAQKNIFYYYHVENSTA